MCFVRRSMYLWFHYFLLLLYNMVAPLQFALYILTYNTDNMDIVCICMCVILIHFKNRIFTSIKKKLQQKVFFNKNFKIYILFKLAVLLSPFPEFANNLIKLNMYVCTYIHVYRLNLLKTANNQNFVKQLFTEQNVKTFFHPTK